MINEERELLERISREETSWSPRDTAVDHLEEFQTEATELMKVLGNLAVTGFIGGHRFHQESVTGRRYIDRVYLTAGLTDKGRDRGMWPKER